jgi:hypothetical protein
LLEERDGNLKEVDIRSSKRRRERNYPLTREEILQNIKRWENEFDE